MSSHMSQRTKPTKWHVRPAKTHIRLGIRPVWSESLLSAWRKLESLTTNWAHNEDSDHWVDCEAELGLLWADMLFCWFCHALAHFCFSSLLLSMSGEGCASWFSVDWLPVVLRDFPLLCLFSVWYSNELGNHKANQTIICRWNCSTGSKMFYIIHNRANCISSVTWL